MAVLSRAEALEILRSTRAQIDELIAPLTNTQLAKITNLGGGTWSVKDLIGHLAVWEEIALAQLTGKRPAHLKGPFSSGDELNDAEIERKRDWTLAKVRKDSERIRTALFEAIEQTDDERWTSKVEWGKGRSTLGLLVGRTLQGGKHGPFAHDLAHLNDLKRSVRALSET